MHISPPEPVLEAVAAATVPYRAALDHAAVATPSAGGRLLGLLGDGAQWIGDNPALFAAVVAFLTLVVWSTRPGPR